MDAELKRLKKDLFGVVSLVRRRHDGKLYTRRDTSAGSRALRWLARRLAAREARALGSLDNQTGVPKLLRWESGVLERSWLKGEPLHVCRPHDRHYYRQALRLVRSLHRHGVAHNDLAKEPNWLVTPDGQPAVIDFQLATVSKRRGPVFRMLAREDLRHLLKLKLGYCPAAMTQRQMQILSRPGPLPRIWMATGKPVYLWITRKLLGWADREGAGDRTRPKTEG